MTDNDGLRFVVGWSVGGLVASALVLGALVYVQSGPPARDVMTERSMESLDQETCRQMMETFVEQSRSGARIVWLWAEESTPRVFGSEIRGRQVTESTKPPRPYAFRPDRQSIPPGACSFPSNSLHVVAIEPERKAQTYISDRIE